MSRDALAIYYQIYVYIFTELSLPAQRAIFLFLLKPSLLVNSLGFAVCYFCVLLFVWYLTANFSVKLQHSSNSFLIKN